eukprot:403371822
MTTPEQGATEIECDIDVRNENADLKTRIDLEGTNKLNHSVQIKNLEAKIRVHEDQIIQNVKNQMNYGLTKELDHLQENSEAIRLILD